MKKMKKSLLILLLIITSALLLNACSNDSKTPGSNDKKIKVRVAHVTSTGSPYDWGAQEFKKLVEESSEGRIEVSLHAGDMATDEIEVFELAQSGNIEIAWVGTGSLGGFVPELEVIGMPFLFDGDEHMQKAFKGEFGNAVLEKVNEVNGVIGLGFHIDGWRNILSKGKPINTVEDMKNLRIRTPMNNISTSMYTALGAVPVSIASGEIYTSLQTNVVDAQDNSLVYAESEGYIDVVDCACIIHHYYTGGIILSNEKWFNELSKEDQEIIKTSAEKAGAYANSKFLDEDEKLIEKYKEKGYIITYPSDLEAWKTALKPVYDEQFSKNPGWKELVDMVDAVR